MALPLLGNSENVVISVSIDFLLNSQLDVLLLTDCLHNHLRDVLWEDIFKLSASAAASESCKWVQIGIDLYIPHCKY